MASFEIVRATGKSACRGNEKGCIAKKDTRHWLKMIPKGSEALVVSVYGAGGAVSAYYCEVCLFTVIEQMEKVIAEVNK